MSNVTPVVVAVLIAELVPAAIFGFAAERAAAALARWPVGWRLIAPAVLVAPYAVLASWQHMFGWNWFALYAVLPVVMAWLSSARWRRIRSSAGTGGMRFILLTLGLAVDLRCFDVAWPAGLRGLGNLLLVDAGLYGFLGVRRLSGTGFDFHFHWSDWKTGAARAFVFRACRAPAGNRARVYPSACERARCGQGGADLGRDLRVCRGAGGTLLPRLGAESFGAAGGTTGRTGHRLDSLRALALQ